MNALFLRESPEGVFLAIKVQPRGSRNQVQGIHGNELKISVTAPPVDAAANEALLRFLAEQLDCPRGSVQLIRGQTSRHKTILVKGLASARILRKLNLS
jgi:uncharacterized protein (TIGR00251 family)